MPSERSRPAAGPAPNGGDGPTMSSAFAQLAELEYRLGDWTAAHASALESLRASQSAGLDKEAMASLVRLACIEAGLGRSDDCRRHAREAAELSSRVSDLSIAAMAGEAVGFLELGLDRIDAAVECLEQVGELAVERPAPTTWATDLAEAQLRRGDRQAAERALARATDGQVTLAPAIDRAAAMLADDGEFERLFRRALAWSSRSQQPFEHARTQLCFGERLQRVGRRQDACMWVSAALESLDSLGARPWAARARRLLVKSGGKLRQARPCSPLGRFTTAASVAAL